LPEGTETLGHIIEYLLRRAEAWRLAIDAKKSVRNLANARAQFNKRSRGAAADLRGFHGSG
jgi:hypothetical protein